MIDGKQIRQKLIGDKEERAVSPVIGVILMVAITVILAAVIASFLMGMGDDLEEQQEATGAAEFNWNGDTDPSELTVSLTSEGNSNQWQVRGDYEHHNTTDGNSTNDVDEYGDYAQLNGAGDTVTLECASADTDDASGDHALGSDSASGTITVVASMDGGESWTTLTSESYSC